MKKITEVDKNFAVSAVEHKVMKFYRVTEESFAVYGLWNIQCGLFQRQLDDIGKR